MSVAEGLMLSAKLCTEGKAEQNRVAAVCRGEAAIASDCTGLCERHTTRQTRFR
jgi:hypothetical protein